MSDENTDERELNVGEYQAYRRKVIGRDGEGNLIFGEREPIEEDEEGNDGCLDDVIGALSRLTDDELQEVQREVMRELYGLGSALEEIGRMNDLGTVGTDWDGEDPVVLPGDVVRKRNEPMDGGELRGRLTGNAYDSLDEDCPERPGSYD